MLTVTFPGYESLENREKIAFFALQFVKRSSPWQLAIDAVMNRPDPESLRKLITDLKSQNADCPPVMHSILGDAYDAVINC